MLSKSQPYLMCRNMVSKLFACLMFLPCYLKTFKQKLNTCRFEVNSLKFLTLCNLFANKKNKWIVILFAILKCLHGHLLF